MQFTRGATPERTRLHMPSTLLLVVILLYLLSACMPIQPEPSALPTTDTPQSDTTGVTPTEDNMDANQPDNPVVTQAVQDLAQQINVPIDQITVVSSENVTWPDGSLGCPQAGMVYMQVLLDGMRIVLSAEGQSYEYHSGGGQEPFLCTDPQSPVPTDSAVQ